MRLRRLFSLACLTLIPLARASAQDTTRYTRADTLRGSNGPERAWWDATFYDLRVRVDPADSTVRGANGITYRVLQPAQVMQIDLQVPMEVDSIVQDRRNLAFRRDSNAYFVTLAARQRAGEVRTVTVYYHGRPRVGRRLPWDGGFTFPRDSLGTPFIATANEGLGASVWWPVKDHLADEPDSQRIAITVPDPLVDVSNGRLRSTTPNGDGTTTYEWFVSSPINTYNVAVNAGAYAHFSDTLDGEAGRLTLVELGVSTDADSLWFCMKPEKKARDPRFAFVQRREFAQRALDVITFHRIPDEVRWSLRPLRQLRRRHRGDAHTLDAIRPLQREPVAAQCLCRLPTHKERHVAARCHQLRAEIPAH